MNLCIIIHNMTIENRCTNYKFNHLHPEFKEEIENGTNVETIFMEDEERDDLDLVAFLTASVAYLIISMEEQVIHVSLQNHVFSHIVNTY